MERIKGDFIQSFIPTVGKESLLTVAAASEEAVDVSDSYNLFIQPRTGDVEVRLGSSSTAGVSVYAGEKWGLTVGAKIDTIYIYSTGGTDVAIWKD